MQVLTAGCSTAGGQCQFMVRRLTKGRNYLQCGGEGLFAYNLREAEIGKFDG